MRTLNLPSDVTGELYLHSMPDRHEELHDLMAEMKRIGIGRVVRLTGLDEVAEKSPTYHQAITSGTWPFPTDELAIPDFGVPADPGELYALANSVAAGLREGKKILIHCAGGIGRTGTLAACVLLAMDVTVEVALAMVNVAGSSSETPAQYEIVERYTR